MELNTSDPFDLLLDYERRCHANAAGLPVRDKAEDEWVGVGFRIGDDKLIAPMNEIAEILDLPEFTYVPGVKSWMVGVANVRGGLLPLMDLKGFILGEDIKQRKKGRVIVFAYGMQSSGIPRAWAAQVDKGGINLIADLSTGTSRRVARDVKSVKRAGDIVVASIHWGGNWGYHIPLEYRRFAHELIDIAGVDIIHGHSSHHAKGIEVYKDRPIIYGCGDLLNDYEGIRGHENYRDDLSLMYFLRMQPATGKLVGLEMVPHQIRRFRLNKASSKDAAWLRDTMDRECRRFSGHVALSSEEHLLLDW